MTWSSDYAGENSRTRKSKTLLRTIRQLAIDTLWSVNVSTVLMYYSDMARSSPTISSPNATSLRSFCNVYTNKFLSASSFTLPRSLTAYRLNPYQTISGVVPPRTPSPYHRLTPQSRFVEPPVTGKPCLTWIWHGPCIPTRTCRMMDFLKDTWEPTRWIKPC